MNHSCLYILIFILLAACNPDKNKRANPDVLKFSTSYDTRLFFKNLRQQAYDLEEMPAAKLLVYRHSQRRQETDRPLLQTAIVINWRYDEAYLLLEPNEYVNQDQPLQIQWYDSLAAKGGIYRYDYGNKEEQLRFAGQLYGSILDGHQLYYLTADSLSRPFFTHKKDRELFRVTLLDYYRLTRNIR